MHVIHNQDVLVKKKRSVLSKYVHHSALESHGLTRNCYFPLCVATCSRAPAKTLTRRWSYVNLNNAWLRSRVCVGVKDAVFVVYVSVKVLRHPGHGWSQKNKLKPGQLSRPSGFFRIWMSGGKSLRNTTCPGALVSNLWLYQHSGRRGFNVHPESSLKAKTNSLSKQQVFRHHQKSLYASL